MGIIISGSNAVNVADAVTGATAQVTAQGALLIKDESVLELLEEQRLVEDENADDADDEESTLGLREDE